MFRPNLKLEKKKLPTIVVDNFFDNVDEIIKLSKKFKYFPPTKNDKWIGLRTESLHINNYELFNSVILKILKCYFPYTHTTYGNSFVYFHKLMPGCKETEGRNHYHVDHDVHLAGIVYLSNGNMKNGTTIFNKNKEKQIIISNDLNTLVCYEGSKYHGPTILNVDEERLTMNIFIEKIITF